MRILVGCISRLLCRIATAAGYCQRLQTALTSRNTMTMLAYCTGQLHGVYRRKRPFWLRQLVQFCGIYTVAKKGGEVLPAHHSGWSVVNLTHQRAGQIPRPPPHLYT
jgi:hypothetical protein